MNAYPPTTSASPMGMGMAVRPFNGRCKYKSGRCMNERTLKENGQPHTLCEEHRVLHNKNQRKSDTKRRRLRKGMPYEPRVAPSIQLIHDLEYRSAGSTYSSEQEQEDVRSTEEQSDEENNQTEIQFMAKHQHGQVQSQGQVDQVNQAQPRPPTVEWSSEEISILHSLLGIHTDTKTN